MSANSPFRIFTGLLGILEESIWISEETASFDLSYKGESEQTGQLFRKLLLINQTIANTGWLSKKNN
jgi:hypothetical protein